MAKSVLDIQLLAIPERPALRVLRQIRTATVELPGKEEVARRRADGDQIAARR